MLTGLSSRYATLQGSHWEPSELSNHAIHLTRLLQFSEPTENSETATLCGQTSARRIVKKLTLGWTCSLGADPGLLHIAFFNGLPYSLTELPTPAMKTRMNMTTPDDRSTPLNVIGVSVTVLPTGTGEGSPKITHQSGPEGAGPPPHSHPWSESFYVTKGTVLFTCDGSTTTCLPGTFVHVPGGMVHGFSFGVDGGEMIEVTANNSQAISMFTALDREVPSGPPDVAKIVEVAGQYDVAFHL